MKKVLPYAILVAALSAVYLYISRKKTDFTSLGSIARISNIAADAMVCGKTREFLRAAWGEPQHSYARADFWLVDERIFKVLYNEQGVALQCDNELTYIPDEEEACKLLSYT